MSTINRVYPSAFSSLLLSFLLASCSSNSSDSSAFAFPESISGNWFICEFGVATDCAILDDDGIMLTSDGRMLRLEETSQGALEQCGGPCFLSNTAAVQAVQTPIGTYDYANGRLSISTDNCSETSTLLISNAEAFIQIDSCDGDFDGSTTNNGSLLRKFDGTVEIVSGNP